MTYYAFIQDNKINGKGQCPCTGDGITCVEITEQVYNNIDHYIWDESNQEVILNPNYDEEQAEIRETNFKKEFFKVDNFGWYRKQPKGYQSAVESMNVLFNIANVAQGIQAGLVIFYQEPDFTIPEQCTEEWLVQHQIVMPAMTTQEFMQLYVAFMTAWNTEEHN